MLSVLCNYLFTVEKKNEEDARLKKNKQRRRKVIHVVQRQKIWLFLCIKIAKFLRIRVSSYKSLWLTVIYTGTVVTRTSMKCNCQNRSSLIFVFSGSNLRCLDELLLLFFLFQKMKTIQISNIRAFKSVLSKTLEFLNKVFINFWRSF